MARKRMVVEKWRKVEGKEWRKKAKERNGEKKLREGEKENVPEESPAGVARDSSIVNSGLHMVVFYVNPNLS